MSQEKVVCLSERVVRSNEGDGLLRLAGVGRPYSLPLMPLTRRSTITRRTGSGPALLHVGSSYHVTGAAYSCEGGGRITQLQYLLQLSCRTSENSVKKLSEKGFERRSE